MQTEVVHTEFLHEPYNEEEIAVGPVIRDVHVLHVQVWARLHPVLFSMYMLAGVYLGWTWYKSVQVQVHLGPDPELDVCP